jgi:hypothetical protein
MSKQIYFPPVDPVWDFDRSVVRFYAVVDSLTVVCNVSVEALFTHFGARKLDAEEAIRAFTSHRMQIDDVARRKIERELTPGQREITLVSDDFRTTTTTAAPVPFPRFQPAISDAVRSSPQLLEAVREANHLLDEDLARGRDHVAARWDLVPRSSSPLLRLSLTDKETGASVEGYFTPDDLRAASTARFSLFLLWDELLRKKTAKILEQAREGA